MNNTTKQIIPCNATHGGTQQVCKDRFNCLRFTADKQVLTSFYTQKEVCESFIKTNKK